MNADVSHRGRQVAWWLFAAGVTAYLTLSASGLLALGIPYDAAWGPFIAKLHPGTWLVTAAWGVLLFSHGHPLRVAGRQLASQPLLALYLAMIIAVAAYSVARYGVSGAAFMVDTLLMPAIAALVLGMLDIERRRACIRLVTVLIVVDVLLGLVESMTHVRLIPMRIGGMPEIVEDIFRPSSLLGHPLSNAIVIATLIPLPLYLRIGMAWRTGLMVLLWIGLLAFGGRTSFVLATVFYGGWFAVRGAISTLRGRFSYTQLTGSALLMMVSTLVLTGAIVATGIGERIFKSLAWDDSASVRARIWDVFGYLDDWDLLVGSAPAELPALIWRIGLHGAGESIENFWLAMFLQLGIIGFLPFAIAMGAAMTWLWRSSTGAMRISIAIFFIAASSNNSLASKTVSFTALFIAVAATRRIGIPGTAPTLRSTSRDGMSAHAHPNSYQHPYSFPSHSTSPTSLA